MDVCVRAAVQGWHRGDVGARVVADGERATFVATRDVRVVAGAADPLFGVRSGPGCGDAHRARVFGLYRQVQRCTGRPVAAGTGRGPATAGAKKTALR